MDKLVAARFDDDPNDRNWPKPDLSTAKLNVPIMIRKRTFAPPGANVRKRPNIAVR
jgi:hypothetical protein